MAAVNPFGLPPFEEIEAALGSDAPHHWGLATSGGFSLIVEPEDGMLSLLCPVVGRPLPLPAETSVIRISTRKVGGRVAYQVGSKHTSVLREVYYFLVGIVHRAQKSAEPLPAVIASELAAWEALLQTSNGLERNQVLGLLGELWVLWRMLHHQGPNAIESWTGPTAELHDFRLHECDLEVKTTLSHSRDHVISGLNQLLALPPRHLSVVSIQIMPAGGGPGITLREAVGRISQHLSDTPIALNKFNSKLGAVGYRHDDGAHYTERYCLRSLPTVVPVDGEFPTISFDALAASVPDAALRRIRKVVYTVNLDGLGLVVDANGIPAAIRSIVSGDLYA